MVAQNLPLLSTCLFCTKEDILRTTSGAALGPAACCNAIIWPAYVGSAMEKNESMKNIYLCKIHCINSVWSPKTYHVSNENDTLTWSTIRRPNLPEVMTEMPSQHEMEYRSVQSVEMCSLNLQEETWSRWMLSHRGTQF